MSDRSRALPMSEADLHALVGHRFPGGTRTIEHWENWLLTDCTGSDRLDGDLVHPIALFHVPIQGAGTSIAELFELCGAQGAGSVGLDGYDWEYFAPLREGVEYRVDGSVTEVERTVSEQTGRIADRFVYSIEMTDPDGVLTARITNHWRIRR
jgi:hypothetical protein